MGELRGHTLRAQQLAKLQLSPQQFEQWCQAYYRAPLSVDNAAEIGADMVEAVRDGGAASDPAVALARSFNGTPADFQNELRRQYPRVSAKHAEDIYQGLAHGEPDALRDLQELAREADEQVIEDAHADGVQQLARMRNQEFALREGSHESDE